MSALLLAQIGLNDLRVVADLIRRALGDDAAEVQHGDALADAHEQTHVMLDQQHGDVELVADAADGLGQLEVAARGVVELHVVVVAQQLQPPDVAEVALLRLVQVGQQRTGWTLHLCYGYKWKYCIWEKAKSKRYF